MQVLNKFVLKWASLPAVAAVLIIMSPSAAQTSRPAAQKPARAASAPAVKPALAAAGARAAPVSTAYASADPTCTTGRKRLWTDAGWVVRRVTSCR